MPTFLGIELHIWADGTAFFFALLAIILCAIQIHHHIYHNHQPQTRRYIIRILLMVAVYSVESWVGLYMPQFALYLDAIRDSYEALVIYSFYQLLIQPLGGYEQVQAYLEHISTHTQKHVWPVNYFCKEWTFGSDNSNGGGGGGDGNASNKMDRGTFLNNCSLGILQYCFIQPTCAIATFIMQLAEVYKEGEFDYKAGYPYIACIRSASQTWAIYCLALFYVALKKQPHDSEGYQKFMKLKPVNKFLCVKGVVFFTYWQSVFIAGLVWLGWIKATQTWDEDSIAVGLQDFIICIEMCFAAIGHMFAFRISDFQQQEYAPLMPPHHVMFDVANMGDVVVDARDTLRSSASDMMLLMNKRKKDLINNTSGKTIQVETNTTHITSTLILRNNEGMRKREELNTNINDNNHNNNNHNNDDDDDDDNNNNNNSDNSEDNMDHSYENESLSRRNSKKQGRYLYQNQRRTIKEGAKDDLESRFSDDEAL